MEYESVATEENVCKALVCVKEAPAPKVRTGDAHALLYAVCSALFSAVALGGLFVGFLFRGAPLGRIVAGGETAFRGSLFGLLVEIARGSVAPPAVGAGLGGILPFVLYLLVPVLAGMIALALFCTIAAFLMPKSAKNYAYAGGFCAFLPYCALFFGVLLFQSLKGERALDVPLLIPMLASTVLLGAMAIARRGLRGVANLALLALSAAGMLAFFLPFSPFPAALNAALTGDMDEGVRCTLLIAAGLSAANFLLSAVRLGARGVRPELFRFGLQFTAALALLAAYLFAGLTSFFSAALPAIFLLLAPLGGFMLSALLSAARKKAQRR